MTTEHTVLYNLIKETIDLFNDEDKHLLINDLSERCICSRFAFHLQNKILRIPKYQDYFVDVEYNRGANGKDYEPKRLSDNKNPITVDLIVHKRGYDQALHNHGDTMVVGYSNLICIEMKKIRNITSIKSDYGRLNIMTNRNGNFGYTIGFMLIIDKNELKIERVYPRDQGLH